MATERSEKSELLQKWIELAHEHERLHNETPVVIGVELYEHFGSFATIVGVECYPRGMDVTLEGRFGEQATVEAEELNLRPKR